MSARYDARIVAERPRDGACVQILRLHGGGTMSRKARYFHDLLGELPEPLQRAIHHCVAACKPHHCPRPYASDWREELYHEAACAACEALVKYDPSKGDLYEFGVLLIGQRLRRFCDGVWAAARCECEWPRDEETGEEVELEDRCAVVELEARAFEGHVRELLSQLGGVNQQVGEWYLLEGWSEREIAERLGCSQQAVSKRLQRVMAYVRSRLGVDVRRERRGDSGEESG
ncbi:RNA polymerase sigma factor, sigma-70 family [Armatimonadetes bacterium DC]|nr:RNA polymerase sigma factor, sigma-70 family [Armatimonadetes bacterium DC]